MSQLTFVAVAVLALLALVCAQDGALISVSSTSDIGVLLDEYPSDVRDRVAQYALSRPDSYWREAVIRQLWMTAYRLVFRQAWYGAGAGKGQLLFPMDQLSITFVTAPRRTNMNGRDVVFRTWAMQTYIVTDIVSALQADPAFSSFSKSATENFQLPLDPYLLFQRTGYACMDEGQFPLDSVDAENPEFYYDDTCGPEAPYNFDGGCNICHCTVTVDDSCRSVLGKTVGKTSATLTYTRIPWNLTFAQSIEALAPYTITTTAGADLVASLPDLNHNYVAYKYITPDSCTRKECVDNPGWRRFLYFDAVHVNVGSKNLDIGYIAYLKADPSSFNPLAFHNLYYWDYCHQHPHFSAYAGYSFGSASGHKQGFCIQTTGRNINARWSPLVTDHWDCSNQGISSGWSDAYNAGIPCQWIDVTNVDVSRKAVSQPLTLSTNPKNWLCEGVVVRDADGNPLWEPTGEFTATGQSIDKLKCITSPGALNNNLDGVTATIPTKGNGILTRACDHAGHNLGPKRDCEFTIRSQFDACTPNTTVNLVCSISNNAASQVIRVCESSIALQSGLACRYNEPHLLANVIVSPGVATPVSFTCPAKRDSVEVGGRYSTYSGAVFNPDPLATITCTKA